MRHPHGLRSAATLPSGGGAIQFIASEQTQTPATSTTVVVNKPTGTQAGDLMVAFGQSDGDATWTFPSGWTTAVVENNRARAFAVYKVAGASEPSSYTFTYSSARRLSVCIVTYRNATFDVVGSIASDSDVSGLMTAPAITLSASGSTLFAYFGTQTNGASWSGQTSGLNSLVVDSDGTAPSYVVYSEDNVGSGSTGTKSAQCSTTNPTEDACFLLGIKPI